MAEGSESSRAAELTIRLLDGYYDDLILDVDTLPDRAKMFAQDADVIQSRLAAAAAEFAGAVEEFFSVGDKNKTAAMLMEKTAALTAAAGNEKVEKAIAMEAKKLARAGLACIAREDSSGSARDSGCCPLLLPFRRLGRKTAPAGRRGATQTAAPTAGQPAASTPTARQMEALQVHNEPTRRAWLGCLMSRWCSSWCREHRLPLHERDIVRQEEHRVKRNLLYVLSMPASLSLLPTLPNRVPEGWCKTVVPYLYGLIFTSGSVGLVLSLHAQDPFGLNLACHLSRLSVVALALLVNLYVFWAFAPGDAVLMWTLMVVLVLGHAYAWIRSCWYSHDNPAIPPAEE